MLAEKDFRPILFAGPLRRVPRAIGAEDHSPVALAEPIEPAKARASAKLEERTATDETASIAARAASQRPKPNGVPTDETANGHVAGREPELRDEPSHELSDAERRKGVSALLAAAANRARAATAAEAGSDRRRDTERRSDPWAALRGAERDRPAYSGPTIRTEDSPEEGVTPDKIVRGTPPFLVSLALHLVLLPLLAAIAIVPALQTQAPVVLDLNYATEESLNLDVLQFELPSDLEAAASSLAEGSLAVDSPLVEDPMLSMPELSEAIGPLAVPSGAGIGTGGVGFSGRDGATKQALLGAFGGTIATEDAVKLGLGWMKRQQQPDGRWLLSGPFSNGTLQDNPTAGTAMALLAFLGDGHTPVEGDFRQTMTKGADALLRMQDLDGNFYSGPESWHQLYSQAQATIAVCELYGMTGDERYRVPAERAVRYCLMAQGIDGGWPHYPGQDSDTSVTGWYLMALRCGEMSGIPIPPEALAKVTVFLDSMQDAEGWRYKQRVFATDYDKTVTAEAVLCRQYLGWKRDDPRLVRALDFLLESPIVLDESEVYYWYCASQTMHNHGGEAWESWNENLREILPALQERKGREQGSWNPYKDEWGARGGRLYMTALCIYTLEIYYRHLPLYQDVASGP